MGLAGRILNRSKDYLFFNSLLENFWIERLRGKVACLLYHRVDDLCNYPFLVRGGIPVIPPEDLEKELRFLIEKDVLFLTFEQLRKGLFPGASQIGFIISFDDCFRDNYTTGLEILKKLDLKAVFFQSTGMINAKDLLWEHALYWYTRDKEHRRVFTKLVQEVLGEYLGIGSRRDQALVEYLREEVPITAVENFLAIAKEHFHEEAELRQIAEQIYPQDVHLQNVRALGHEIGSHGHHHYKRSNIDEGRFEQELTLSSKTLEQVLGERPAAFSYPFNSYFESDDAICSKYFLQTVTVDKAYIEIGTNSLRLPRFTWPGPAKNPYRRRRWLLTGSI